MNRSLAWEADPNILMCLLPLGPRGWLNAPGDVGICQSERSGWAGWTCGRPNEHSGRHAAYLAEPDGITTRVVAVWP